jgi:hypothetical protein
MTWPAVLLVLISHAAGGVLLQTDHQAQGGGIAVV